MWGNLGLAAVGVVALGMSGNAFALDYADRLQAQRSVERVLWAHRIWPEQNRTAKPPLEAVLPEPLLRSRVDEALRQSHALQQLGRPISAFQLQRELDRMARNTRDPQLLSELFAALNHDPRLIAEVLARPVLANRTLRSVIRPSNEAFESWWERERENHALQIDEYDAELREPDIAKTPCSDDRWSPFGGPPAPRYFHVAVWTGVEMLIWGGSADRVGSDGSRYDPATDTWTTITTYRQPAGRDEPVAVWTGTEMIVHGDANDAGGRYNPLLDRWTAVSTAGAPSFRFRHTAVWTGSRMIVWGGTDGATPRGDGASYDPALDLWQPISVSGAPSARSRHVAVWTGSEMLVWGGASNSIELGDGARYRPDSDQWVPMSSLDAPTARERHRAVWTGTEMMVWGGRTVSDVSFGDGARYDPLLDRWQATNITGAPTPRHFHSMVWTGSHALVWGGVSSSGEQLVGGQYDPSANSWSALPIGPTPRYLHTAIWTGREMIVWGGLSYKRFDSGARYDPISTTWLATSQESLPLGEAYSQAVWTGAEMLIWGGEHSQGGTQFGVRYSPAVDQWSAIQNYGAPSARSLHAAVWTGSEMIVWGGLAPSFGSWLKDGARYSPTGDFWLPMTTTAAPAERGFTVAVWSGNEMIVWGGQNGISNTVLRTGGRYNPNSDTWTPVQTIGAPAARTNHRGVWDGARLLVWGGRNSAGGLLNTGSRYDPATDSWSAMTTTIAPSAREDHAAVWTGNEMVVWGGAGGGNTGGRYDPLLNRWRATSTVGAPLARTLPTAIWTGSEMIVWGGGASVPYQQDGGRYDPVLDAWRATSLTDGPLPQGRVRHVAVWNGNEMIVWGGWVQGVSPTGNGGRYCACAPNAPLRAMYRDTDGDGYGATGSALQSCVADVPFGWSLIGGDCDDTAPDSWNAPGETGVLGFATHTLIRWLATSDPGGEVNAIYYDLLRSNQPSDFDVTTCVVSDTFQLGVEDPAIPPLGTAFNYLVRADNSCPGAGSLGNNSAGTARTGRACP